MGLGVIVIALSFISGDFLTVTTFSTCCGRFPNALLAFGMTFVILTGGSTCPSDPFWSCPALCAGMIAGGTDPILAVLAGLAAGTLMGAANGLLVAKGRVAPFIATLATMTIYRGLTRVYTEGRPITFSNETFSLLGKGYFLEIPVPVIWMLLSFLILSFLLRNTTFGRHIYAVGGNEEAAVLSGIRADRVKIRVYAISGLFASLAGIILTSRLSSPSRRRA